MQRTIKCLVCGEFAAIDDGMPNFEAVPDEHGRLKLEEVPLPSLCENHDLRLRMKKFEHLVTQLTHP